MGGFHHVLSIKLVPTNYLEWTNQFESIINYYDLGDHIKPLFEHPSSVLPDENKLPVPNPAYISWFKKDQMLHSWILSSLSEEVTTYTIGLKTSVEIWAALRTAFGTLNQSRIVQLNMQLQLLKKNDLSVTEYLRQIKMISDELQASGKGLDQATINAFVFNNLGEDYSEIVAALTVSKEPLSSSELTNALVGHEIRLGNRHHVDITQPKEANLTSYRGGRGRSSSRGSRSSTGRGGQ